MASPLAATLVKLLVPLLTIAIVLTASRVRGIAWVRDLGLRWPAPRRLLLWLAIWIAWMAAGEVVSRVFHVAEASPWKPYPATIVVLRILAIGLAGPAAEEFVVRGILFFRLRTTRLGAAGAIPVCAAAWALMHYHYDAPTIALIFCDGIVLGVARWRLDSTWAAVVMHSLGNLYSIYQSLHPALNG